MLNDGDDISLSLELCSTQVWALARDGRATLTSASDAQSSDRYKGPDRARRYEEAKLERRRRQEKRQAAAPLGAQKAACKALLFFRLPALDGMSCLSVMCCWKLPSEEILELAGTMLSWRGSAQALMAS